MGNLLYHPYSHSISNLLDWDGINIHGFPNQQKVYRVEAYFVDLQINFNMGKSDILACYKDKKKYK